MASVIAGADIAYVATVGAAGLALAVSAWAWRLDARARRSEAALEAELEARADLIATRDACLALMREVRVQILGDADGELRAGQVFGDPDLIATLTQADQAAGDVLIARVRDADAARLKALVQSGVAFDLALQTDAGVWRIEGRALAGSAWLRFTDAEISAGLGTGESAAGLLADASPVPTWVVDSTGRLAWANRAWLAAVKAGSLEDALQRQLTFDRGADAIVADALRQGTRQEGFRWTATDGRRKAWRVLAEPSVGGGAVTAFAIEMTEAEETRDTLRRHVEAHDETLNHLADAVAIFGPSKRLAFHNTAFQTLFDLDPAWLDERPTHAELLDRLRQRRLLPEVIDYAGWRARELEFYGATEATPDDSWSLPDGRTLRVVRQPHPLGGILLIFSDITDELNLRSLFNGQIQVQRATLDKLNDAVAVFGSDGRLRLHNEAFSTFWGPSAHRFDPQADFEVVAEICRKVLPDAGLWLGLKARVADPDPESRVAVSGEGRTVDGRIAAWQTRPLPDGATLVAFSDVTAQRALEQALAEREAALAESQALKREFVGSVSYELRTPLTTIVGYSELLEASGELPDRSRQHAGAIRIAATQLARSIDDVLDMAQIDAGEMDLSIQPIRLADLLTEAAEAVRARIEGRGARLTVNIPRGIGEIEADRTRVAQALDHLLDNAARAVSEGGLVTLEAVAGEGEVRLRVSDTGRGIPYHLQPHVFDRFVRRERGGPGVGLALTKALVELHGGWAEVESVPGEGATFSLHLPRMVAAAPADDLERFDTAGPAH